MINKIINNPKYRSIVTRVVSAMVFTLLFILICVTFEFVYRGSVINQINKLINDILFFGL
jgi:hypothetical protein